ncbi:SDR family NAD(P)-dependent oxidoreductase [Cohnella sp. JJ-181]|uniref:SDR family NAD(P)-dependent oxidoreductase n=1 Tax=Cohnella rhizoplanae TaxID=2974897 RepID=UPI0022FF52A2|nr:SDR family NAD(P)-dependent oxidoreductase [Cohnella sp. JJ-181]CAI6086654.1 3-oxoacyl-[acyl-carrier-protein] reductase FabG [Cohnella sp. JJ-181]
MDIKNRTAIVTGGGTGIGRAVSLELAASGTAVVVNYSRSRVEAEETVEAIRGFGGQAVAVRADVSVDTDVRAMVRAADEAFGSVDLLVNNASVTRHIPMQDLEAVTDDAWDELVNINVKGMFYCARAAAPLMVRGGGGAIVNVGSIAGKTGQGSSLPYAVSKAAVHGLTLSLARALAPRIRVNAILPGAVGTRWWAGREEQMQKLAPATLLASISSPEDIARAIRFALEQESMTGQLVTVDGGQTL